MAEDTLWYVAYGSNLSPVRLRRYLVRCAPVGEPLDRRPVVLPHRLFFAHESRVWTGGTAFVEPRRDPDARTLAMAWLLRRDQFLGVLARENGCEELPLADHGVLGPGESVLADRGRYGLVLGCDSPDHRPALTFTTSEQPRPAPTSPAPAYVDTIVSGLMAGHGLTDVAARAYVTERVVTPARCSGRGQSSS